MPVDIGAARDAALASLTGEGRVEAERFFDAHRETLASLGGDELRSWIEGVGEGDGDAYALAIQKLRDEELVAEAARNAEALAGIARRAAAKRAVLEDLRESVGDVVRKAILVALEAALARA